MVRHNNTSRSLLSRSNSSTLSIGVTSEAFERDVMWRENVVVMVMVIVSRQP